MTTRTLSASLAIAVALFSNSYADPTETSWFRGADINANFRGDVAGGQVMVYAVANEYLARANVEPKEYLSSGALAYGFFDETATGKSYYFSHTSYDIAFKRAGSHYQASATFPVRWCVYSYPDPPTDCIDDTLSINMDVTALEKQGFHESVTTRREFPEGLRFWENREGNYMPVTVGDTYLISAVFGMIPVKFARAAFGKGKILLHF